MTATAGSGQRPRILPRTTVASDRSLPWRLGSWTTTRQQRRHPTAPRIGLLGLFGSGNSGNDGSLEAMLRFLRQVRPHAQITCICSAQRDAPDRVTGTLNVASVPLGIPRPEGLLGTLDRVSLTLPRRVASLVRAIARARKLDALIVPGTGILDDFGSVPYGIPLTLYAWCLTAKLCGARIAFVSIGAGPIHHPISRWLMRSAVAMAHYRSYRDTVSKTFMESIGLDTRDDPVYPDIAFKLPSPETPCRPRPDGRLVVGVGVMTYLGWRNDPARGAVTYRDYLDKLTTFVLWLLDQGYAVRLLMGDLVDQRAVSDVLANVSVARPGLPKDRLMFDTMSSLHDLMRQISETDVVVATRYHNVVCALKLGKPTVSIGYAAKNDVLMAEMGVGRFCQHVERLDLDLLIEQFSKLIADRVRYGRRIRHSNLACQERLDRQDSVLAACLP